MSAEKLMTVDLMALWLRKQIRRKESCICGKINLLTLSVESELNSTKFNLAAYSGVVLTNKDSKEIVLKPLGTCRFSNRKVGITYNF